MPDSLPTVQSRRPQHRFGEKSSPSAPAVARIQVTDFETTTYRKVTWRLIPFLFLCYILALARSGSFGAPFPRQRC